MKRNLTYAVIGLTLGLVCGFKISNSQFRKENLAIANAAALQSAAQARQGTSVNPTNDGEMTPAERQQLMNQARAVVERARANLQDFEAQHQAAEQFMQIQRHENALEFLLKANQLRADDPEIMADLAETYFFTQRLDQAITWARRALERRPNYPIASFYLMASLIETKQNLDEAETLLAELEKFKPGDRTLAQMRQSLRAAEQEVKQGKAKSTLLHGPEAGGGKP
jgi:tetratricopeptide (TPR) repeat protein